MAVEKRRLSQGGVALAGLVAIVVLAGVPALVLWVMRDRFPQEVATHWGIDGQPDGWMSLSSSLLVSVILSVVLPAVLLGVGAALRAAPLMTALAVGTTAFTATLSHGSIWLQRDGGEAEIGPLMLVALGLAVVVGVVVGLVLSRLAEPIAPGAGPASTRQAALPVVDGKLPVWEGSLRVSRGVAVFAVISTLVALATAVITFRFADPWFAGMMLVVALVLALAFLSFVARVRIDDAGLRVSVLGIPFTRVALAEITGSGTRSVEPLGDYGGFGYRLGLDGQSQGWVTSGGEAVVVSRTTQRALVLTVDDADHAAAVLTTLIQHRTD